MSKLKTAGRKILVAITGIPLLIIGIILIPLPGPGLLVCFAAFFILSLEFDWAKTYLEKIRTKFKEISSKSQIRSENLDRNK